MSQSRGPVVGWLMTTQRDGCWPGVLLHGDGFLVDAPQDVLQHPPSDLAVRIGTVADPVAEIRIIAGPQTTPSATAMVRLLHSLLGAGSVGIDRDLVTAGWSAGANTSDLLRGLGLLPARWPDPPADPPSTELEPGPVAVKTVQAAPADWCTIFWWLC